jgi:aminocarboxymuconate-semialdehyde decarboxylase
MIMSSLPGHYPDDDDAFPFFELACALDVPIFIHPPHVGFGEERMRDYRLASSVGRPMDGALAIARLIVRGIFEKLPKLKLVGSHLGGGICEMIGRMDYAYTLQDEAYFLGPYEPMLIKHRPSHYLKMMYLESTCYHLPAARCALETVGADHFVFGTDAPPLKVLKRTGLALIRDLKLPPEDEGKVLCRNAAKLLKI